MDYSCWICMFMFIHIIWDTAVVVCITVLLSSSFYYSQFHQHDILCDMLCQNPLYTCKIAKYIQFSLSISSFIDKLTNYCNTSQKLTDLLAWSLLWLTTPSCTIITNIRCINIHSTSTINKYRLYQQGFW